MSDAVRDYYDRFDEAGRLDVDVFQLEAARTRELLERFLPAPPARVVDVGGGAGAYAFWLAERGHEARLLDLSPRLVEQARERSAVGPPTLAESVVGDARELPWADASADAALLLGPLYHLTDATSRNAALREARRVLAPGGRLVAAAISRFASLLDGIRLGFLDDATFEKILRADLETGQHRNPTGGLSFFTTAYFHRPEELGPEVAAAGFEVDAVLAVEGPGWLAPDFAERWRDSRRRAALLDWIRRVEAEPALLGASAHLLAFARRP